MLPNGGDRVFESVPDDSKPVSLLPKMAKGIIITIQLSEDFDSFIDSPVKTLSVEGGLPRR